MVVRGGGRVGGEGNVQKVDEDVQKVPPFSYRLNKFWGLIHKTGMTVNNTVLYI